MNKERFRYYKEYPKTCEPDDFWGQVKRTVNGTPVSQEQIDMIVEAVKKGLELESRDVLLDICCGNGALSTLLFSACKGGLGVDFSEYLISVANKNFAKPPRETFLLQDAIEFCARPEAPEQYTKALCYGSFAYIEDARAQEMLALLKSNFPRLRRIFIGNCPDKALLGEFFRDREYTPGIEDDPDSLIGIWRTEAEFVALAARCGWRATISRMPEAYYASHYRYDVVLEDE